MFLVFDRTQPRTRLSVTLAVSRQTLDHPLQLPRFLGIDRNILLLLGQPPHENHRPARIQKIDIRDRIHIDRLIVHANEPSHALFPQTGRLKTLTSEGREEILQISELILHQLQQGGGKFLHRKPDPTAYHGEIYQFVPAHDQLGDCRGRDRSGSEKEIGLCGIFAHYILNFGKVDTVAHASYCKTAHNLRKAV